MAGFFHPYYLSILGAPLAALVGIAAASLWKLREQRAWLGGLLLAVGAGLALVFQYFMAHSLLGTVSWLPWMLGLWLAVVILLAAAQLRPARSLAIAGFASILAA